MLTDLFRSVGCKLFPFFDTEMLKATWILLFNLWCYSETDHLMEHVHLILWIYSAFEV